MKPIFEFRLVNGSDYYYNDGGHVLTTTDDATALLEASVVDWDKLGIQYKRHNTYLGVFRSYVPETVRFCNDAAVILRYVFANRGGIEAECSMEIRKLNSTTQAYEVRGVFDIDFSRYKDSTLYVDAGIMEGGLSAIINGYSDVNQRLTVGSPESTDPEYDAQANWVWMDGVMLGGDYRFIAVPGSGTVGTAGPGPIVMFPLGYQDQEGIGDLFTPNAQLADNAWAASTLGSNTAVGKCNRSFTGNLTFSVPLTIHNPGAGPVHLYIFNGVMNSLGGGGVVYNDQLWDSGAIAGGATVSIMATATVISRAYQYNYFPHLTLVCPIGSLNVTVDSDPAYVQFNYLWQQDATPCRSLRHRELFQKLINRLTAGMHEGASDLLDTDVYPGALQVNPYNTFFTSGDCLRQLPTAEAIALHGSDPDAQSPSINISLKDFAKSAFVSLMAGIGIEKDTAGNDVLRLERLGHFFRPDILIADLGDQISNWECVPYTEHIGNSVRFGYEDKSYDDVNGRYEFNTEYAHQAVVKRVKSELDLRDPVRADCYGAEYTRANLAGKTTTDGDSDNDVFKLQSSGGRTVVTGLSNDPYKLDKSQASAAGLPADVWPTVFNIPFSPARNMYRLRPWLKSVYYGISSPILRLAYRAKNAITSYMYAGPGFNENASIDLTLDGTGTDILFKPYVFNFKAKAPINLPDLMEGDGKYGVIGYTLIRGGKRYYMQGFVLEAGIHDATNEVYEFSLLCAPGVELPV